MKKSLLALTCLALPLFAMAGDAKPASKAAPKPHAVAASAAAPAASAVDSHAAVHASKHRSTAMGACQRQALDKNLMGEDRRQFVLSCLAAAG